MSKFRALLRHSVYTVKQKRKTTTLNHASVVLKYLTARLVEVINIRLNIVDNNGWHQLVRSVTKPQDRHRSFDC